MTKFHVEPVKLNRYPDDPDFTDYRVVETATGVRVATFGMESAAEAKAVLLNRNIGSFNGCPCVYQR